MVRNPIKVCARIKGGKQPKRKITYAIKKRDNHELLCVQMPNPPTGCCRVRPNWFSNIFDKADDQEKIFSIVAQPIINSFLNGFNATIFAYGQTGSGKTYTITGPPEDYHARGIIPRSIEQVFRFTSKSSDKCSVCISYMEIYNEVGYDLLDSKHQGYTFEQLPKVVLLEDSKGEAHLRNLSMHNVSSEKEAMRLLFLGDTNRTIAETPLNEISSRSHCIFTIYLSFWVGGSGKMRRSKLNLVDLAGSERIHKSNITGVTLMEAKSINLSLYYLEQVILALSEVKRTHVPYRNSIMTNILKDSLGGNCFTLMLATITIDQFNLDETLSTCKFSQRVAMVSTDAYINEDFDPYEEIAQLSKEIECLKDQLKLQSCLCSNVISPLTDDEISQCRKLVDNIIKNPETTLPNLEPNMRFLQYCFYLMKNEISRLKSDNQTNLESSKSLCDYDEIIKRKDEEIAKLNELLENALSCETGEETDVPIPRRKSGEEIQEKLSHRSKEELRIFKIQGDLSKKYDIAKSIVPLIEQCQKNIIMIRKRIDSNSLPPNIVNNLVKELQHQQNIYRESLSEMQNIKAQVEHLEHGLQQAEFTMGSKLKQWVSESSPQGSMKLVSSNYSGHSRKDSFILSTISKCACSYEKKDVETQVSLFGQTPQPPKSSFDNYSNQETSHRKKIDKNESKKKRPTDVLEPLQYYKLNPQFRSKSDCDEDDDDERKCPQTVGHHVEDNHFLVNQFPVNPFCNRVVSCSDIKSNSVLPLSSRIPPKTVVRSSINASQLRSKESPRLNIHVKFDPEKQIRTTTVHQKIICRNNLNHVANCSKSSDLSDTNPFSKDKIPKLIENLAGNLLFGKANYFQNHSHNFDNTVNSDRDSVVNEDEQVEESKINKDSDNSEEKYEQSEPFSFNSSKPKVSNNDLNVNLQSNTESFFKDGDSSSFRDFIKTVPLTGDKEVDEEIVNFYRTKFEHK